MKKPKKDKHFIKKPRYPGGRKAMLQFISAHKRYPEEAARHHIKGVVRIRIGIDESGRVVETRIIDSPGYGCDEEAIRLARLLRFEPVKNRGVKVITYMTLNISFAPPQQPSFQYDWKPSSRNKPSEVYQYSINIPGQPDAEDK